jgi:hypothetical protein
MTSISKTVPQITPGLVASISTEKESIQISLDLGIPKTYIPKEITLTDKDVIMPYLSTLLTDAMILPEYTNKISFKFYVEGSEFERDVNAPLLAIVQGTSHYVIVSTSSLVFIIKLDKFFDINDLDVPEELQKYLFSSILSTGKIINYFCLKVVKDDEQKILGVKLSTGSGAWVAKTICSLAMPFEAIQIINDENLVSSVKQWLFGEYTNRRNVGRVVLSETAYAIPSTTSKGSVVGNI